MTKNIFKLSKIVEDNHYINYIKTFVLLQESAANMLEVKVTTNSEEHLLKFLLEAEHVDVIDLVSHFAID